MHTRVCCVLVALVVAVSALYEDQAGLADWYEPRIGRVSSVAMTANAKRRLFVGTESNVVASISSRSGELEWRFVFDEEETVDFVRAHDRAKGVVAVTGGGTKVHMFAADRGLHAWEVDTSSDKVVAAEFTPSTGGPNDVVVLRESAMELLSGSDGRTVWSVPASSLAGSAVVCSQPDGSKFTTFRVTKKGVTLTTYSTATGKSVGSKTALEGASGAVDAVLLSDGVAAWLEADKKTLTFHDGKKTASFKLPRANGISLQNIGVPSVVAVYTGQGAVAVVGFSEGKTQILHTFTKADAVTGGVSASGDHYAASVVTTDTGISTAVVTISASSTSVTKPTVELSMPGPSRTSEGAATAVYADFATTPAGTEAFRLFVVTEADTFLLVKSSDGGSLGWRREEALADIKSVDFVRLPLADGSHAAESDPSDAMPPIVGPILARLTQQLTALQDAVTTLSSGVLAGTDTTPTALTGDAFGFNQLILCTTQSNTLYALSSIDGSVVWRRWLGGVRGSGMFVMTSANPPRAYAGVGLVRSGESVQAVRINTLTGELISSQPLGGDVKHAFVLARAPSSAAGASVVVLIDSSNKVTTLPDGAYLPDELHYYAVDEAAGNVNGFAVVRSGAGYVASPTWSTAVGISEGSKITVAQAPQHSPLSAVVRVVEYGNVQFRHVNTNSLVVVTEVSQTSETGEPRATLSGKPAEPTVHIHILNTVSGAVVHHTYHRKASGPVAVTHFDNTVVYQVWNVKLARFEVGVIDLYDGPDDTTDRNVSEYSVWSRPGPVVESQSFIFPYQIRALAPTTTLRGITFRGIVAGLASNKVVLLSRRELDAHRFVGASPPQAAAEGDVIYPYSAVLGVNDKSVVSYTHSVAGISGIATAPCVLESHSLVFVYGLDLFFTRVMPSKAFDLLGDDFQTAALLATIVGLGAGYVTLSKLARRKRLASTWK